MREPPEQAQHRYQQDRDADRFMQLVELEQCEGRELHVGHDEAHRQHGDDPECDQPVKRDGDAGVAGA